MPSAIAGPAFIPPRLLRPLLLAALCAGCAGQPLPRPRAHDTSVGVEGSGPLFVSPARWDYHPPAPDAAVAWARLPGKGCVFTAEGGQRWVSTPAPVDADAGDDAPGECAGKAEAAATLAPEELTAVIRRSERSWIFIGEGGTLYEAPEPLAAFTRTLPPPEPLTRVAGAGPLVLATTSLGKLLRWDDQSGWREIPSPPKGARLFDVAVAEGGRALALAFPEALFTSGDGGATWAPASAKPIGARLVGLTDDGELAAQGLLESIEWSKKAGTFSRSTRALPSPSLSLDLTVSRGPSSAAVTGRRAVIDGDRYFEVIRPDGEGDEWLLARGKIEGRLATVKLPKSGECGSMWLGGRGKHLFTVCVSSEGSDIAAEVRHSADAGDSWSEPLALITPDTDQVNLAVSTEGNALIAGVCKSGAEGSECRPLAPVLVRADGDKLRAMVTGAPQLTSLALVPAFSFDSRSAYFLGRRVKDDRFTLFVSHDGGETFSQRSLDAPVPPVSRKPEDEDDEGGESEPAEDYIETDEWSAIRPGEDGTVGLMVRRYRGLTYMTLDDDGRVLSAVVAPTDDAIMAGFGRHVVAFASNEGRPGEPSGHLWESSDGGSNWDDQPAPDALLRDFSRSGAGITCALGGCLFGETISRVGWGGQADPAAHDLAADSALTSSPAALTPITCELSPTVKWTRVEHSLTTGATLHLPDINEAMRGRSAWSILTSDPATGAVTAVSATLPESGEGEPRIVTQKLLGSRPSGGHAATAISRQMEGYAAVRAAFSTDKDGAIKPGTPMRNVEVVWENYMEGTSGRARIADAGVFEPSDVQRGGGDYLLETGLITVTLHGIVVRPHSLRSRSPVAFFLDAAGKAERLTLPAWPSRGLGGSLDIRGDAVAVDGQVLGVGMVRDHNGEVVSLLVGHRTPAPPSKPGASSAASPAPADHWDLSAFSLAPSRSGDGPEISYVDWTYTGKAAIGVTSIIAERRRSWGFANFFSFRADGSLGPPVPLPTLGDLGDRPRPCAAAERAASPRFEALLFLKNEALFPGMRHPVLVSEPPARNAVGVSAPLTLLTGAAVAHGTPASPCVAGWEANGVGQRNLSAILSGDLARSWIFRAVPVDPSRALTPRGRPDPSAPMVLEYRPMSCRFDPSARVPDAVWNEPGTARIER